MSEYPNDFEVGVVIELNGENAVVRLERKKRCHSCSVCEAGPQGMLMTARASGRVEPGDRVVVSYRPQARVKAAVLVFAIPLITMLVGGAVARLIAPQAGEWGMFLGVILGLFGGLLLVQLYERKMTAREQRRIMPQIQRVLD